MGDVILGSVDWVCFDGLFGAGEGPQSRDFLHLAQNPQIVVPRIWGLLKSTDCGSSRLGGDPLSSWGGVAQTLLRLLSPLCQVWQGPDSLVSVANWLH